HNLKSGPLVLTPDRAGTNGGDGSAEASLEMHLPFESHAHLSTMAPGVVSAGMLMKAMSARESNNAFGLPIDTARKEPVTIEKHGRPVIVVMSFEEYQRL